MDAHAATARLEAVHHKVVRAAAHGERVRLQQLDLIEVRLGEGLVLGLVALGLVVPVEEREVYHPEEVVALARNLERVGHV